MDPNNSKDFTFAKLSDLKLPVTFRISQLEGTRKPRPFSELLEHPEYRFSGVQSSELSDLYVTCQLFADNKPLTIPYRTSYKSFKKDYIWNEWITLPYRYCDLPLNSQLSVTVWDIEGPDRPVPVGGSTFRMFGKKLTLRRGQHRLVLWRDREADGAHETSTPSKIGLKDEMGRLEKLVKKYERGDLAKLDWLDKLAFRRMEEIHAAEQANSDNLFLYVDLPRFDFPVIYTEPEPSLAAQLPSHTPIASHASTLPAPALVNLDQHLWCIADPDVSRENPVEDKHTRLIRSHRSAPLDRDLKPNAETRDTLNEILNYPPTQELSAEDKNLIWKFRFYLTRDKRGLTKFLKSVTWRDASEVKQAVEVLLPMWVEIELDDALELLGPGMVDSRVRTFAVRQLRRADDDELLLYLLQLVQALKFERLLDGHRTTRSSQVVLSQEDSGLADFLIERGAQNPILGNRFHWYLMVEVLDQQYKELYAGVVYNFMRRLEQLPDGIERRDILKKQGVLVEGLSAKAKEVRAWKDARPKKIDKLRAWLGDSRSGMAAMEPLPFPLNDRVRITGVIADKSSVLKSALSPLLVWFQTEGGGEYPIIFKNGDDLRQDQLVNQLFTLMDRLLRKENLDLKISPYAVLATGPTEGMVQFVPSKAIAAILSEYGTLLNYLRANNPDEGSVGTYGVRPDVIDTFVRSCAGYSVVTYILGVGDRHLDNLMLAPDGHFFHVDFGYILGRDPKPFPPPVKVCKEMVDAMGGATSKHYNRFKSLCYTAFTILRKNANLILNLATLMIDARITDINQHSVHEQLQEKFLLQMTEEEAIKAFETLLNETSYFTVVFDRIHDIAQYWRS
ncbi:atypical/PIKK/PI3K protein kinase [Dacryopinax primogenitus]|uniref:Phosphatidylinositol 3-kinase VPS34 n=1 Tax=Dacryopinax primogenitus (strain DJM 731) TaxID=1858805 RepID=M5G9F1_DACPD|nr:atypical/PIKK/PI3K protein kinase [Dacryopinax primogenitus]EJU04865.1 atypical/PIKK/PI3K protein kinase [Dacryopinax primogenitus]